MSTSKAHIEYDTPYTRNDEMYAWNGKLTLVEDVNGVNTRRTVSWSNDHKGGRSEAGRKAAIESLSKLIVDWIERP